MAKDLKIKIGADTKDAESGLKRTAKEVKNVGDAAKTSGGAASKFASDFKGELAGLVIQGTLAATALAAVSKVMTSLITEASESEQAMVKLNATLKNTGELRDSVVAGITRWSNGLLQAKGVSDELSMSLVAMGGKMGLNVAQSEDLVSVAADMAVTSGTVESNFEALARATDGDTRALGLLARQFNISVGEGESFATVLGKIKDATGGAAAAQIDTLAGKWKLLWENIGNLSETLGTPALEKLKSIVSAAAEGANAWNQTLALMSAGKSGDYSGVGSYALSVSTGAAEERLADARERYNKALAETNRLGSSQSGAAGAARKELEDAANDLSSASKEYQTKLAELRSRVKADTTGPTVNATGGVAGVYGPTVDQTELDKTAKAAQEATKKVTEARAKFYEAPGAEGETLAADITANLTALENWRKTGESTSLAVIRAMQAADQAVRDTTASQEQVLAEAAANREGGYMAGAVDQFYSGNLAAAQQGPGIPESTLVTMNDQFSAHMDEQRAASKTYYSELDAADERRTDQFRTHLDSQTAAYNAYVDDKKRADEEAAAATAATLGNAVASAIYSVGSGGDMESALGGLAVSSASSAASSAATSYFGSEFGKAAGAAAGPIFGALAGTGVSLITDSLFGSGPTSVGGQLREQLSDALSEIGLTSQTYQPAIDEAFYATGQADFWQKMSEQIVGSDLIGEGGQMLMGAFDGLDLSMTDTISVMGGLIATAQGLTDVQGEQLAAQTALLSNSIFTATELSDLAIAYGSATAFMERQSALQEQILGQAQDYYDKYGEAGNTNSAEFAALEASRAEYIGLLANQDASQKASDDALQSALEANGMSAEDASDLVRSNHTVEQNTGEMVGLLQSINTAVGGEGLPIQHAGQWPSHHSGQYAPAGEHVATVRNDELIAPPEQFGRAARYLADRGFYAEPAGGASGGGNVYQFSFPNYLGSQREVAEIMSREMATLERRKKIA